MRDYHTQPIGLTSFLPLVTRTRRLQDGQSFVLIWSRVEIYTISLSDFMIPAVSQQSIAYTK